MARSFARAHEPCLHLPDSRGFIPRTFIAPPSRSRARIRDRSRGERDSGGPETPHDDNAPAESCWLRGGGPNARGCPPGRLPPLAESHTSSMTSAPAVRRPSASVCIPRAGMWLTPAAGPETKSTSMGDLRLREQARNAGSLVRAGAPCATLLDASGDYQRDALTYVPHLGDLRPGKTGPTSHPHGCSGPTHTGGLGPPPSGISGCAATAVA